MANYKELVRERRGLFDQFCEIRVPRDAARFQRELANAIRTAERRCGEAKNKGCGEDRQLIADHAQLLRTYGDAIAWKALHSHAIRQLRKQGVRPANLSGQWETFAEILAIVEQIADAGGLAIACDLTNCLRLGDIIVADDPERPTIIECKKSMPKDGGLLWGRTGRQLGRLLGTASYLREGAAFVLGDEKPRICIEASKSTLVHWRPVQEAVGLRMGGSVGVLEAEPGQVLWARHESDVKMPDSLGIALRGCRLLDVGAHLRFCDDDAPNMAPPLAWPIPPEQQWALSEGDVQLFTLLDIGEFADHARARGRVMRVVAETGEFVLDTDAGEIGLSSRFVDDCLYSYHSLAGTVDYMLDCAEKFVTLMQTGELPGGSSLRGLLDEERHSRLGRAWIVRSGDDAATLIQRTGGESAGIVFTDTKVWADIVRKSGRHWRPGLLIWPLKTENENE